MSIIHAVQSAISAWPAIRRELLFHLTAWALLLFVLWLCLPQKIGCVWMVQGMDRVPVQLPWYGHEKLGTNVFEVELLSATGHLSVRADDCITQIHVDNLVVYSAPAKAGRHCSYTEMPLLQAAKSGGHLLRFTTQNLMGETWFDIKEAHWMSLSKVALLFFWGISSFCFARWVRYSPSIGWIVAISGFLAIQYLDITPPWVRQHDVEGHREYVDILRSTGELPGVKEGWETWQPPVYYCLAAAWQSAFPSSSNVDPFRSVQVFGVAVFLLTILVTTIIFRQLGLGNLEAGFGLGFLAFMPGCLFFAARINNDVVLPVIGAGITWLLANFIKDGKRKWLFFLSVFTTAALAAKGSSLAVVGTAFILVAWAEHRRANWRSAIGITYMAVLPAVLWFAYWCYHAWVQTGDPLYVNAALPDHLRIKSPALERLFSFHLQAFISGSSYYDEAMRNSYPTALITSLLNGEYGFGEYGSRCTGALRVGLIALIAPIFAGLARLPRPELRIVWGACLCLALAQAAITTAYTAKYAFACNQNIRFFAQAFVPFACLGGIAAGQLMNCCGRAWRWAFVTVTVGFTACLVEFYARLLF